MTSSSNPTENEKEKEKAGRVVCTPGSRSWTAGGMTFRKDRQPSSAEIREVKPGALPLLYKKPPSQY